VQTADSKDMRRQQTLDLADYLNNNFSGVNVSESADNPFQLDINTTGSRPRRSWARRKGCPSTWTVCVSMNPLVTP